jgi:hypothetical protein
VDKAFLDSYGRQTTAELITLKETYRIDSLVLAFEQAIQNNPDAELSIPERFVLAIEAMEREVNNGGWDQFFLNTNSQFDTFLDGALDAIGCPETSAIARAALDIYQRGGEVDDFEGLDSKSYALTEPIADRLFQYIVNHQHEIRLPT